MKEMILLKHQKDRDKLVKVKKERFIKDLDLFFKKVNENSIEQDIYNILNESKNQLNTIRYLKNLDEASQKVIDIEFDTRKKLSDYKKDITISNPKGFTISKSVRVDFDTYLSELKIIEETLFKIKL